MSSELTEYESIRAENIKRNEAFLKSLGLAAIKPPPIVVKSKHRDEGDDEGYSEEDSGDDSDATGGGRSKTKKRGKKRKVQSENAMNLQPTRRSSRRFGGENAEPLLELDMYAESKANLQGLRAVIAGERNIVKREYNKDMDEVFEAVDDEDESHDTRKRISSQQLREFIVTSNKGHSELVSDEAIVHCTYRISSMSDKRLETRAKMIAKAAGKQSKEKLLVFYYGLLASNLNKIAEKVLKAIKRLDDSLF